MKTIVSVLPALLFLLLINFQSLSQSNYLPGFIVNLTGDTLRGEIDYRSWERNPLNVSFRLIRGSTIKIYYPVDIRSFSVANEFYEGAIVDVDSSPYKLDKLADNPEPVFLKDTVFLQSLVRGEKNLLSLTDRRRKIHFYIFDTGYQPLVYKQFTEYRWAPQFKRIQENNQRKYPVQKNACAIPWRLF